MAARTPILLAALLLATPAVAQDDDEAPARVPVIQQLYDCRAVADPAARLACFDRQVAAMETAETARDIRIVDRATVRETRRGLFGFSLENLNLFGGGDDDEDEPSEQVTQIESTIASISVNSDRKYVFTLANGQRWLQTDPPRGRSPQVGMTITISRASLGGYNANINDRPAVRVLRQQ
jgi:hypothetical protein